VLDLFIDVLTEPQAPLNEFGMVGLCNLSPGEARLLISSYVAPYWGLFSARAVALSDCHWLDSDPQCARFIIENQGLAPIITCLGSTNIETVLAAMATLYYLLTPSTKACMVFLFLSQICPSHCALLCVVYLFMCQVIATDAVISCMQQYAKAKNERLQNLATLFLETSRLY